MGLQCVVAQYILVIIERNSSWSIENESVYNRSKRVFIISRSIVRHLTISTTLIGNIIREHFSVTSNTSPVYLFDDITLSMWGLFTKKFPFRFSDSFWPPNSNRGRNSCFHFLNRPRSLKRCVHWANAWIVPITLDDIWLLQGSRYSRRKVNTQGVNIVSHNWESYAATKLKSWLARVSDQYVYTRYNNSHDTLLDRIKMCLRNEK